MSNTLDRTDGDDDDEIERDGWFCMVEYKRDRYSIRRRKGVLELLEWKRIEEPSKKRLVIS